MMWNLFSKKSSNQLATDKMGRKGLQHGGTSHFTK